MVSNPVDYGTWSGCVAVGTIHLSCKESCYFCLKSCLLCITNERSKTIVTVIIKVIYTLKLTHTRVFTQNVNGHREIVFVRLNSHLLRNSK